MRKFLVAVILLFIIDVSLTSPHKVISASMENTLLVGDTFIALKFWFGFRLPFMDRVIIPGFKPEPGELLIFKFPIDPTQTHVKRCIAVGGQTVEIVEKKLFVDGYLIPLPPGGKNYDQLVIPRGNSGKGKRDFFPEEVVPDTTLFVLGDNRDFSIDSRIWGFLPKKDVRGKVWFILFSINPEVSWLDFKNKVRWNRIFKRVM